MAAAVQLVNESTFELPQESASVRTLAKLFFATFLAILLTGAVRKWVFPGAQIVYLLQDVPIGVAYLYALWKGIFDRGYLLLGIIVLTAVLTLQGLAQIIISGLDVTIALAGFHNYLFYFPMLVVFPLCLTEKYRRKFIQWYLLLSIPMCFLALAQAVSPKSAWINQTTGGDAFGVPGADVARLSGTFNAVEFYGIWVGIAVALCMGEWLTPKERRVIKNRGLLILCTFTVNLCHLVAASRHAVLLAAIAVIGGAIGAVVLGSNRALIAIAGICVLLPVAAGATYVISPAEFNIVVYRFSAQGAEEDLSNRISDALIGFATIPRFSLIGAGIGLGVNAAHAGDPNAYQYTYTLSETDDIRNVMELGTPVGMFYILIRLGFGIVMIFICIRMVRSGSTPHLIPLSFVLFALVYGDMTRNATMTSTQIMVGYAFILGAYYYPERITSQNLAAAVLVRTA